jgi:hypothetical protein
MQSEKNEDQRLVVDLRPVEKLNLELKRGDQIDVRGIPVQVKGKAILIARSLEHGGEDYSIARISIPEQQELSPHDR